MDRRLAITTALLCALCLAWLGNNSKLQIDYQLHPHLLDPVTGAAHEPRQLLQNFSKVINQTEDYIAQTNAEQRLYDLAYNTNFENPSLIDQSYSNAGALAQSGLPVADASKCGAQLAWLLDELTVRHPNYALLTGRAGLKLTQLMDSFGRPESGTYAGMLSWLGSYQQCLAVGPMAAAGIAGTRYCIGRFRSAHWPRENPRHEPTTAIRVGLCLPESCDTSSFGAHNATIERLAKLQMTEQFARELEFHSMFCLPDERSPLRQVPLAGRVYLAVLGGWLALVAAASLLYEARRLRCTWRTKKGTGACCPAAGDAPRAGDSTASSTCGAYSSDDDAHSNGRPQSRATPARQQSARVAAFYAAQPPVTLAHLVTGKLVAAPEAGSSSPSVPVSSDASDLSHASPYWRGPQQGYLFWVLVEAFSLRQALKEFKANSFRVRYADGQRVRVNLTGLDFFRVLMAILVVLGHSGFLGQMHARSLSYKVAMSTSELGRMAFSIGHCVNTFYVFFGVLTTYTLMRKFTLEQLASPLTWLKVNVGIFLRVTPLFMLVYWYSRAVSPYTGSGPWWDYGVDRLTIKGVCLTDPWYKSIPYLASTGSPPVPTCLLPGWFIVGYVQISLLLPTLTYIIWRMRSLAAKLTLVAFLLLISALNLGLRLIQQTTIPEEGFTLYGGMLSDLLEKFENIGHTNTLGRLGSVALGCLVGYLLRQYELYEIKRWPAWLVSRATVGVCILGHALIILLPIIGYRLQAATGHLATTGEFIAANMLTMIIWPALNSILIIYGSTVANHLAFMRFMGHTFWHVFNRLGFCIFLIHWEIMYTAIQANEQAPTYGFVSDVIKMWTYGTLVSIVVSLFIYLTFESPLARFFNVVGRPYIPASERVLRQHVSAAASPSLDRKPGSSIAPPVTNAA